MAEKPRIKLPTDAKKGEVIEIKTLIAHPMETGLRKDQDGKVIPRKIINKFTCEFNGKPVFMRGYMAPPLKPESRFFVLTRQPLALCPFCQSDAEWPVDIVVIYLKSASPMVSAGEQVVVTGRLEVGSWTDPESGFVSQIRISDASFRRG